jgi:nitroimidazol reductase NimA-like FMN-containing flavoprotein (pyridoxamine 5'-phosphate oxidase superfamily)
MPVGRVAVSVGALPVVLPVNFSVLDGDIVFRTVAGTKFHAASAGAVVAFETDSYDPDGRSGWSVLVQGVARVVTDPDELDRVQQLGVDPWAVDGDADRVIRITRSRISGRRFVRSS